MYIVVNEKPISYSGKEHATIETAIAEAIRCSNDDGRDFYVIQVVGFAGSARRVAWTESRPGDFAEDDE